MGEPPFLLADVCRNTETGRLLILLGGAGKEVGQDRAGDVVPHGEHGAGDGGQRILSKVGGRQAGGQAGVLHTDLNGDGAALAAAQMQGLAHGKTGGVAQQVVQDDHGHDQQAAGEDFGGVGGNHGRHDGHDGGGGDQRQNPNGVLGELMEEVVDDKAQSDGNQNHLHDGEEHTHHVHVHALARIQQGEQRGEEGSQDGGYGGHADGQGHIALGQVGHHVGGGAAGAGAHQDDAHSQLSRQVEQLGEQEGQERHQGELGNAAHDHVLGAAEHNLEVGGLQGEAHAEHNDAQQVVYIAGFDEADGTGRKQGKRGHGDDDRRHVLAHKVADFFQCFHVSFPLFQIPKPLVGCGKAAERRTGSPRFGHRTNVGNIREWPNFCAVHTKKPLPLTSVRDKGFEKPLRYHSYCRQPGCQPLSAHRTMRGPR